MIAEITGLHERIPVNPGNGLYFERIREFWGDPRYVILRPIFSQIYY